ncbi:MAG: hypothetical protein ACK5JM_05630 [Rhodoblastus sp.]
MKRTLPIFLTFAALALTGCAGRPFSMAAANCTERMTPSGPARICETATQVTVEQGQDEGQIVARDPEPRMLGLSEGAAADRIIASASREHAGRCTIDREMLRETLSRYIARKLLADL